MPALPSPFTPEVSRKAAAVVTGAGSGIGRALAVEIARRGGRVACADIDSARAEETARLIGSAAAAFTLDVRDATAVEQFADDATRWLKTTPDLVVNNAGVGAGERIGTLPLADWHWVIDVNLWGVIHGCHTFAPRLRDNGRGAILNVASSAAFGSAPGMGPYNVSKAGVLSLSETLAAELAGSGVRVGVLCPTFVKTNIARDSRTSDAMKELAEKLMARTGMDADTCARYTLDALDRDTLYILPQFDARVMWGIKRRFPRAYTRLAGQVARLLDS
jgi:NAD(P)-dependent dehydrogenase (short-subunit alcohol dehydrogenase family)